MINCKEFFDLLVREDINFFYRVPDSLLKHFNTDLMDNTVNHVITANEGNAIAVSTTGKSSRELFELRESNNENHEKDFLTVGSMGHSSSIALAQPKRPVYCIDGDGALLMHIGALSIIGSEQPKNFKHIIINNFAHDSVGGQQKPL